ncbi:hypothetical protein CONPUDRAFT_109867 [Coniophora puteana RWD-64-598 SS2]|uniref:DUF6533 domain-containing protein n=1 Tax=Coniophora puteana (strain RWD-64-598) TaxID=741705 RepID=A0A5M3MDL2_CONPW|nr:uncharacterized protein CONPUDRAFT_109867 [Coniophora puteana RWD-64-598 SS2]EIW77318.1 hypothetical protein CONPUDRAFT_109867 [Coniophora puteana RWD-64-598 SS2]
MSSVLHPDAIANLSPFVLLCYEWTLTLSEEVDRYWMRPKLSWAALLFFSNRYLTPLGHVPIVMETLMQSAIPTSVCQRMGMYNQAIIVIIQLIGGVVMATRVYAMYDRCRRILALMVSVAAIALTIGIWAILTDGSVAPHVPPPPSGRGCILPVSGASAARLSIAWGGQTIFDALIFGLTVWQSWKMHVPGSKRICGILLRDGALYFCIITLTNVANILTLMLADDNTRANCTTLTNIICSMMISRLMLNLRDPKLAFTTAAFTDAAFTSGAAASELCAENYPVVTTHSGQPLAQGEDTRSYDSLISSVQFADPLWDTSDTDSSLSLPPKALTSPCKRAYLYA